MSLYMSTRNTLLLFVSCLLPLLFSCQSGVEEAPSQEGECTVNFSVTNYRQVSFDDFDGTSRAGEKIVMSLKNLSLTIFDAETNKQVGSTILHDSDDYSDNATTAKAFSNFSVSLPYGHYYVLVLGYNNTYKCNIASLNHISWENDYVPNTFLYCEEFTLDKDANLNREVTLKHVVAAFRVETEDAAPAELKKMRFISSAGGTVLDATKGFTSQNTGRTSDIVVPAKKLGVVDTFTVYVFLPEEQIKTNYTVQALGVGDAVLYQKRFSDVPLRINYLTEWEGIFFEEDGDDTPDVPDMQNGLNIRWTTAWADTIRLTP